MKRNETRSFGSTLLAIALIFPGAHPCLRAGTFVSDFNSDLPANASIYGSASIPGSGGFGNSGTVQLTPDLPAKAGSFVITNDLDGGIPVVSFTAKFKVLIGGGDRFGYGDGMSFNFAPDVPLAADPLAEQGVGSGLKIGMRTTKDATAPNPAISLSGAGTEVSGSPAYVINLRANTFVDMVVQLNPDNTVSVIYDGVYLYSNVYLGYTPGVGSLFWIGARTGGSHEKHLIDNLSIETRTNPAPFIKTFAPGGRQVPANGSVDIVLTDNSSSVNTNTIVLRLDGLPVAAGVTQDGSGNTLVHFAPANAFAASSQHAVSISFTNSAAEAQSFSWEFTVAEAPPTNFVTIFSDSFESYALDVLDKNAAGANAAANGSGNPWFGPFPDNFTVVGTDGSITPHSGSKMIKRSYTDLLCTVWLDLAYRFHGGQPIKGNCRVDWWFYDANDQVNGFFDYVSLYYYNSAAYSPAIAVPYTADWKNGWNSAGSLFWGNGFVWGDSDYQSLSLGGSGYNQNGGYYNAGKYQFRLEEMATGITYGIDGWCNTVDRSQGWHHSRIVLGAQHTNGTVYVYFFIDDMANPVYSALSTIAAHGINLLEIDSGANTTRAYYDDVSFALVQPPDLVASSGPGGNTILTWPGEGFTLQSAATLQGPYADIPGATSGYPYNTASSPSQYFRLRN